MAIVSIKKKSKVPKYKQIIVSIEDAITKRKLKKGDKLPSLNAIKNIHKVSRDTVLIAFKELKNRGIINSVVGKGYYVSSEDILIQKKVFLLFDELNSFKEDLYNAFITNLDENIEVEIFFHHFNRKIFDKLINDHIGDYSYYVIMPANFIKIESTLQNLPKEKVYLLDQIPESFNDYPAIYQNFKRDIFKGLSLITNKIKKYQKIILLFSESKQPKGILDGLQKFCNQNNIEYKVIASIENRILKNDELYFILNDKDLIRIIKKAKENHLILTRDIGIISFNDTLLKEVFEGGITTISTDFKLMGKELAKMILSNSQAKKENPSKLILRNSL